MNQIKTHQIVLVSILLLSALVGWWQAVRSPDELVYGIDEQILWEQSLFLHFNCIPIALEWPASLFSMGLYGLSWVSVWMDTAYLSTLLSGDLNQAHTILNHHLYLLMHDFSGVVWGRLVLVMAKVLMFVMAYKLMRNLPILQRSFVLVSMAVSIALFKVTSVLHPDSLAVYVWTIIFLFIQTSFNSRNLKHHWMLMLATTILCATKITYGVLVPVFVLYGLIQVPERSFRFKILAIWAFGFAAAFCLACPWLVTDPITMLKAVASNLMAQSSSGEHSIGIYLMEYIPQSLGLIGLICVVPGMVWGYQSKKGLVIVSFVLLLIFALPVMMASTTHLRYAMPVVPILVWYAGVGFQRLLGNQIKWATVLLGLMALLPVYDMITVVNEWHQPTNKIECVRWIETHIQPNEKIEADASLLGYLDENEEALNHQLALLNNLNRYRTRLQSIMNNRGLPYDSSLTDEDLLRFQNRFHEEYAFNRQKVNLKLSNLHTQKTPKYNIDFVSRDANRWPPFVSDSFDLTFPVIITSEPLPGMNPIQQFDSAAGAKYFVYNPHS